jgi:hypothetical protein
VRARDWLAGPVLAAMCLGAGPAAAHIDLMSPLPRTASLKYGPCGAAGSERGGVINTYLPGETITVTWEETVDHPGHFRVAFDDDGEDVFRDPSGFEDISGGEGVLIDGIPDRSGGGIYSQEVTLPDVECDNCTLQVIQVMSDKPPYGDGTDMYYQCADLVLSVDADPYEPPPAATTEDPATAGGDGCGCRSGPMAPALAVLLLAPWWGARRRRSG